MHDGMAEKGMGRLTVGQLQTNATINKSIQTMCKGYYCGYANIARSKIEASHYQSTK
jgi:hypothetical protein